MLWGVGGTHSIWNLFTSLHNLICVCVTPYSCHEIAVFQS